MGTMLEVRCTHCQLAADHVAAGVGLDPSWQFFEVRLFYCARCQALRPAKVLQRARALMARLVDMDEQPWSVSSMTPGQRPMLELTPSQLATLLLEARRRPRCECKAPLRGSVELPALDDGVDATTCPRCGERSLVTTNRGPWD